MADTLHHIDEPKEPKDLFFDPEAGPTTRRGKEACARFQELYLEAEARHRPRTRQRKAKDAELLSEQLEAILANLVAGHVRKKPSAIAVPQSKQVLGRKDTHRVLNDKLPSVLDVLHQADLLIKKAGNYSEGRQATIEAGSQGQALIAAYGLTRRDFRRRDRKPIVLRARKTDQQRRERRPGREMTVPDIPEVRHLTAEVNRFNEYLAKQDIKYVGPRSDVDDERKTVHRVFNNGSLSEGGRVYGGFWQSLSGEKDGNLDQRCDIRINGERLVGLDYGQIHIRLLYSFEGKQLEMEDAYILPGWEKSREGIKKLLNSLINDPAKKVKAVKKLCGDAGLRNVEELTEAAKQSIYEHHGPIAHYFGGKETYRLFYTESNLLMELLMELVDKDIPALPIHDCLYVRESDMDTVRELMKTRFIERYGVSITVR